MRALNRGELPGRLRPRPEPDHRSTRTPAYTLGATGRIDQAADGADFHFWTGVCRRLDADRAAPVSAGERADVEDRIRAALRALRYLSTPRDLGRAGASVLSATAGAGTVLALVLAVASAGRLARDAGAPAVGHARDCRAVASRANGQPVPNDQAANRLTISDTFCPPNPKLFDRHRSTFFSRGALGM